MWALSSEKLGRSGEASGRSRPKIYATIKKPCATRSCLKRNDYHPAKGAADGARGPAPIKYGGPPNVVAKPHRGQLNKVGNEAAGKFF